MKLLHIIATPRQAESSTLRVSQTLIETLLNQSPDLTIEDVDLYHQDLPAVAGANIDTKYALMVGRPIDRSHAESWREIELLIDHFTSADGYLITTPMWNFSIPYALKYYIDCIVQPGYTFRFDSTGQPVPLVLGKSMICVASRGGDYSTDPMAAYDFQEPYLRAIFGYIGISDVQFINAEPMDITPALREAALTKAMNKARTVTINANTVTLGPDD